MKEMAEVEGGGHLLRPGSRELQSRRGMNTSPHQFRPGHAKRYEIQFKLLKVIISAGGMQSRGLENTQASD